MCKNYVKFINYINANLDNTNEKLIMINLFQFHNVKSGYSFPSYKTLMEVLCTSSNNRLSKTIKSLEKKGLLLVDRSHRKNNKYYIVGIENFITTTKTDKKDNDPVEDDPINEVEEVEEVDPVKEDERITLAKNTITIGKVTRKLRKLLLNTDTETVKTAIENVKDKTIVTANYFYNAINFALDKVKTKAAVKYSNNAAESVKGFNNFSSRNYTPEQYASIEEQLTAWI